MSAVLFFAVPTLNHLLNTSDVALECSKLQYTYINLSKYHFWKYVELGCVFRNLYVAIRNFGRNCDDFAVHYL